MTPLEHAYLTGFLAELADLDSEALDWYQRVESGPNANRALLHRAGLEGQQGQSDGGTQLCCARSGWVMMPI